MTGPDEPGTSSTSTRPPAGTRPDASMSLLRNLLENPLDGGYRSVAEHRPAGPPRRVPWWHKALVVVVSIAIGMGLVWAAEELRAPQDGSVPARSLLVEQIRERTTEGNELAAENARYAAQMAAIERAGLALVDDDLAAELKRLAVPSGTVAVSGSGIVVRLTDSPAAQQGLPNTEEERVTDVDLQVLVNSLWASGAEAIAVNDRRLGSTTAIRRAGQAILINLYPVMSPYEVEVIGDPSELQTGLARSPASSHLSVLQSTYNITVEIEAVEELEMAALSGSDPRLAEPLEGEDVASARSGVRPSAHQSADANDAVGGEVR
ncbi:DUF881 domain-containing protein [Georgenia halophila]|uniref:DUF881 domain-containing protein n=1 Tax=Georgenia halophila TaxID=620889 RepID=A0ABP8LAQ6_9MICO